MNLAFWAWEITAPIWGFITVLALIFLAEFIVFQQGRRSRKKYREELPSPHSNPNPIPNKATMPPNPQPYSANMLSNPEQSPIIMKHCQESTKILETSIEIMEKLDDIEKIVKDSKPENVARPEVEEQKVLGNAVMVKPKKRGRLVELREVKI